jgi:glycosyltransferase involved in cell wall biosynthesis
VPANDWVYGPKQYFHDLAETLAKKHDVYVWHFRLFPGRKPCYQKVDKVKLVTPPSFYLRSLFFYYFVNFLPHSLFFAKTVRKLGIDTVIVLNLIPSLWSFLFAPLKTLKVFGLEDYYPESASVYYEGSFNTIRRVLEAVAFAVNKVGLKLADLTLSPCFSLVNLSKGMGCSKSYFLPNGVDTSFFRPLKERDFNLKKKLCLSEHTIAFFGLLENWLDFDTVLDGLKLLKTRIPDVKLLIIGSSLTGHDEALKKKLDDADLADDVVLTGYVPNELVSQYLNLGDVCLMPYKLDNFSGKIRLPLKLFIYSAMAKPILSVSLPEVKRFKPKHIFFYNDVKTFVDSAERILKGENLPADLETSARNFAMDFDYSRLARSCEEIMIKELENKRAHRA